MALTKHSATPIAPVQVERFENTGLRAAFRVADSWARVTTLDLSSGLHLTASSCHLEPGFSFVAAQAPSEVELMISRGDQMRAQIESGHWFERGGHALTWASTQRPLPLHFNLDALTRMDSISLRLSTKRLTELLGAPALPSAFRAVTESPFPDAMASRSLEPGLYRLLEEMLDAGDGHTWRRLWLEAKSLELVALATSAIAETEQAEHAPLSPADLERVHRVRQVLLERLESPPTLTELARHVGFSETTLKGRFRAAFGEPIFTFSRRARLDAALRLLEERRLSVSEVALRVGYDNPSKFAAAFRAQHGLSPSEAMRRGRR